MNSSFKISKRNIYSDNRTSIIQKHEEKIKNIENEKLKLGKYKTELNKFRKLKEISTNTKNKTEVLDKKILELESKIHDIENETELCDYLFNAMEFIIEEDNQNLPKKEDEMNNGDIYKFFSVEQANNKGKIYNDYINKCFPNEKCNAEIKKKNRDKCSFCNGNFLFDEHLGYVVCVECGVTETRNLNLQPEWNFIESHEYIKPYTYKRPNHFKEWLCQVQGISGCNIPDEMIDLVFSEIKLQKINDRKMVTHDKVKEILRKLKLNKYYEQIPTIIHRITGNKQLILDRTLEENLIKMFEDIQEPFEKHCPPNRKNFLSYSYTIHKFLQLLGKKDFLVYFPLLKSRQKLFEQENIWKNICNELNWEFIPSI